MLGSPPPMRGKVLSYFFLRLFYRITPAYAGKSCREKSLQTAFWDHPRLCGEKALSVDVHSSMTGSPPPMRGKANIILIKIECNRITPAYAGKSLHPTNILI